MTLRPRLRTILLVVNLIILMLPVAGVTGLRIYDNALLRQTESALLAQGSVLQAAYKTHLLAALYEDEVAVDAYGLPREVPAPARSDDTGSFVPRLDVTQHRVRSAMVPGAIVERGPDQYARYAGAVLSSMVKEAQEHNGARISVVDWRGIIVAPGVNERYLSIANQEEVGRALRGEVVSTLREGPEDEGMPWFDSLFRRRPVEVSVAVPIALDDDRVYGAVVLTKRAVGLGQALREGQSVFIWLLATLVIAVSIITLLTTFTIQRPIRRLIRQARRIAATGGATRMIDHPGTVEFQELSQAIAQMARTLEERNEYIRTFARDVSHEFKTPLASIKGTVELLEDHFETMSPEKRAKFLSMISGATERLDRLVRRLLELARADVLAPTLEWVDGADVLPELAARSGVNLSLDLGGERALPVAMAFDVFESVFANLFDNAAQHGGENVTVEVIDSSGEVFKVLVSDDGPGISRANVDKVFHSFFTTARDDGGTGLGLSIVKALVQRHGGDIVLTPAEGRGASFLLTLPRAGRTQREIDEAS